MSWVLRRASVERTCDSCDDLICIGRIYTLMASGERFCQDCPPEEETSCTV